MKKLSKNKALSFVEQHIQELMTKHKIKRPQAMIILNFGYTEGAKTSRQAFNRFKKLATKEV